MHFWCICHFPINEDVDESLLVHPFIDDLRLGHGPRVHKRRLLRLAQLPSLRLLLVHQYALDVAVAANYSGFFNGLVEQIVLLSFGDG